MNSNFWIKVENSNPPRYVPVSTKTRRVYKTLNGDAPPTPLQIKEYKQHKGVGEGFDWGEEIFKFGVYYDLIPDPEPPDQVALPDGYYELIHVEDVVGYYLVQSQVREDEAVTLGSMEQVLHEDMASFLGSRDLYEELKCCYRRGYLLYGPPGTGKTTLVRGLLRRFEDAICIHLRMVPPTSILTPLRQDPRLKVFVFEELTEQTKDSSTLSDLLQFLDGETTIDNSICVATTNYSSELPANIVERPGRFDLVLKVPDPDESVRRNLMTFLLGAEPDAASLHATEDLSTAAVKEVVLQSRKNGTSIVDEAELFKNRINMARRDFNSSIGY